MSITTRKNVHVHLYKKLVINRLSLIFGFPLEIADEISGFCFRDKMKVSRQIHAYHMAEIVDHFNFACVSRIKPTYYNLDEEPNTCEHWVICLSRVTTGDIDDEKLFQAKNCRVCGNYKECNTFSLTDEEKYIHGWDYYFDNMVSMKFRAIPNKLRCYCEKIDANLF